MRFTVTWHAVSQGELARIWLEASDRQAVTAAADRIDKVLSADPSLHGEEVKDGVFEWAISPVKITFKIRTKDRVVEVLTVALLPRLLSDD